MRYYQHGPDWVYHDGDASMAQAFTTNSRPYRQEIGGICGNRTGRRQETQGPGRRQAESRRLARHLLRRGRSHHRCSRRASSRDLRLKDMMKVKFKMTADGEVAIVPRAE